MIGSLINIKPKSPTLSSTSFFDFRVNSPSSTNSIWPIFKLICISITIALQHTSHVSVKRVVATVSYNWEY